MANHKGTIRCSLLGGTYGRLTVIGMFEHGDPRRKYLCRCSCGKEKRIGARNLVSGSTRSCGCLRRETAARRATQHGHYYERLHGVWNAMKQRCSNPNSADYQYYGGRGICVCPEWQTSYEEFRAWALANGYREGLTIDRIDVDGNYEPSNCRWITIQEQQQNRRLPRKRKNVN